LDNTFADIAGIGVSTINVEVIPNNFTIFDSNEPFNDVNLVDDDNETSASAYRHDDDENRSL
jgi:hypothetical protein